jgi:5-methylcytosine-specific restriction endonuclease McrA
VAKPPKEDSAEEYISLDPAHTDPGRIKLEREKARKLRKSQWWLAKLSQGLCQYCGRRFPASQLTMDHVIPLARGGTSAPGNIVPACSACNRDKKLKTPVDEAFAALDREKGDEG